MSSPPNSHADANQVGSDASGRTGSSVPTWQPPAMLRGAVHALGFWGAIVLPFLHIPLLVAGLTTRAEVYAFVLLLAANAVAVWLGQGHSPGDLLS